ncbi:MAG: cytochrome b/b6 domain-containing protein [Acidobacteriota bacterium]
MGLGVVLAVASYYVRGIPPAEAKKQSPISYWALVWGSVVMAATGALLWFDNYFIQHLPKGALDVALVVHYWEAWLATLAILIWHLYAAVFDPRVYPMNPSWLTGRMPENIYGLEHAGHLDQARKETAEIVRRETEGLSTGDGTGPGLGE